MTQKNQPTGLLSWRTARWDDCKPLCLVFDIIKTSLMYKAALRGIAPKLHLFCDRSRQTVSGCGKSHPLRQHYLTDWNIFEVKKKLPRRTGFHLDFKVEVKVNAAESCCVDFYISKADFQILVGGRVIDQ